MVTITTTSITTNDDTEKDSDIDGGNDVNDVEHMMITTDNHNHNMNQSHDDNIIIVNHRESYNHIDIVDDNNDTECTTQ